MIRYATVGSSDLPRAIAFYDDLLGTIGMRGFFETRKGGRFWGQHQTGMFAVLPPYNGGAASVGNGTMAGFCLPSPEAVRSFHQRAIELGGMNEGDPGPRGTGVHAAFFAYFRDLDGNKLCAYAFPADSHG